MDDDLYSRDQGALGPGPTENAYPGRLSGLRSSYSILPTKPHPGSAPIRGIRDGADTLDSVDSLLASRNSGQLSQNGVSEISSIDDIMVKTADRPQFAPNPLDHVSTKTRGLQLPVKHTNQHGTQIGILLPKYHIHPQSKCIMCRDCGIFFSHDSFLRHFHDNIGRRKDCQSTMLELGIDNPGVHQLKLWDDFLAKLRGESNKRPRLSSYDPTAATTLPLSGSRSYAASDSYQTPQPPQGHRPAMLYSPRTSMHTMTRSPPTTQPQPPPHPSAPRDHTTIAAQGPVSEFNRNIQNAVDASERLLRETSHFLASTDKSRHRRNRSVNLDLGSSSAPMESKPQASRSLFNSSNASTSHNQLSSSESSSNGRIHQAIKPQGANFENGATDGRGTARFPHDTRMFAGGDLPNGMSGNGAVSAEHSSRNSDDQSAGRVSDSLDGITSSQARSEIGSRPRIPRLSGGGMSDQERQEYKKQGRQERQLCFIST